MKITEKHIGSNVIRTAPNSNNDKGFTDCKTKIIGISEYHIFVEAYEREFDLPKYFWDDEFWILYNRPEKLPTKMEIN